MRERNIFNREARATAFHNAEQAAILVLSALAIGIINLAPNDRWRFWGNVVALAASPFWLHANWITRPRQWGQFALSITYACIWIAGITRYH